MRKLVKLIDKLKRPALIFHHEDLHVRLDEMEKDLKHIKELLSHKEKK